MAISLRMAFPKILLRKVLGPGMRIAISMLRMAIPKDFAAQSFGPRHASPTPPSAPLARIAP